MYTYCVYVDIWRLRRFLVFALNTRRFAHAHFNSCGQCQWFELKKKIREQKTRRQKECLDKWLGFMTLRWKWMKERRIEADWVKKEKKKRFLWICYWNFHEIFRWQGRKKGFLKCLFRSDLQEKLRLPPPPPQSHFILFFCLRICTNFKTGRLRLVTVTINLFSFSEYVISVLFSFLIFHF